MVDNKRAKKSVNDCIDPPSRKTVVPTNAQMRWLGRGLNQPGGKLPLFDEDGAKIRPRTIQSCVERGWAEPWFRNSLKPDWLVCRLTETGRALAQKTPPNLKR